MNAPTKEIPKADAEYHLELLLSIADDLFQRHAYFTLWRIRWWSYQGFTGDYFHWPYAGELIKISFIEELNWIMQEPGHEMFAEAYAPHLRQACKPAVEELSCAEEEVMSFAVCQEQDRDLALFEITDLIKQRLFSTIIDVMRGSDMDGLHATWTGYGLAFETTDGEEN
jgi:hypothetical protein